jgi:hypothetical protein
VGVVGTITVLLIGAFFIDRFGRRLSKSRSSPADAPADGANAQAAPPNVAGTSDPRMIGLALVWAVAFLTVCVFAVFETYAKNLDDPRVRPVALVVREQPDVLWGTCAANLQVAFIWRGPSHSPRTIVASRSGIHG